MSQAAVIQTTEAGVNRTFILTVCLIVNLMLGIVYAFSIFIIPLETSFGWARHETALTFSFVLVFFSFGLLTGGNVMAKFGPGRTVAIGGVFAAVGSFIASFTVNKYMLYVSYGLLTGYGLGLASLVPTAVLMRWFPDKKGLATGLAAMFLAFGTFIMGSKVAGWLVSVYGWTVTFKIFAAIFIVIVSGLGLLLKFPPAGFAPAGWTPPPGQTEIWGYSRPSTLKTTACWLLFAWLICIQMGGLMVIGHVVPFAAEQGVSMENAAMAMGIYAIANGIGRLFFGWSHDRFGLKPAMFVNSLFMACGLAGMIYLFKSFGFPGLIVAICLVGMSYGGTVPLTALLVNSFFGPKFFAKNFGMSTVPGVMIGGLIGPVIGGYIKTVTGSYTIAILSAAVLAAIGTVVSTLLKAPPPRTDEA